MESGDKNQLVNRRGGVPIGQLFVFDFGHLTCSLPKQDVNPKTLSVRSPF